MNKYKIRVCSKSSAPCLFPQRNCNRCRKLNLMGSRKNFQLANVIFKTRSFSMHIRMQWTRASMLPSQKSASIELMSGVLFWQKNVIRVVHPSPAWFARNLSLKMQLPLLKCITYIHYLVSVNILQALMNVSGCSIFSYGWIQWYFLLSCWCHFPDFRTATWSKKIMNYWYETANTCKISFWLYWKTLK